MMTVAGSPNTPDAAANPARPRYYILDTDPALPRFEFLNREQALFDPQSSGAHRIRLRGLDFMTTIGVPSVRERPRLKVGSRQRGKAPLDLYSRMFFSDRFKRLLCAFMDEDAVEMIECDAVDLKGGDVGPYWWMDFIRVLDAVDEERSVLTRQIDNPFASDQNTDRVILETLYLKLQDIHMRRYFRISTKPR